MFVAYLWGIETATPAWPAAATISFVAYLWGIETCYIGFLHLTHYPVCSLPMRDWNRIVGVEVNIFLRLFVAYLWGIETVARRISRQLVAWFVAYLWGIETW